MTVELLKKMLDSVPDNYKVMVTLKSTEEDMVVPVVPATYVNMSVEGYVVIE